MTYESFNNSKNKIEKNWNSVEKGLSDESRLIRQQNNALQTNLNPVLIIIPLITHNEKFS